MIIPAEVGIIIFTIYPLNDITTATSGAIPYVESKTTNTPSLIPSPPTVIGKIIIAAEEIVWIKKKMWNGIPSENGWAMI